MRTASVLILLAVLATDVPRPPGDGPVDPKDLRPGQVVYYARPWGVLRCEVRRKPEFMRGTSGPRPDLVLETLDDADADEFGQSLTYSVPAGGKLFAARRDAAGVVAGRKRAEAARLIREADELDGTGARP